MTNNLEGRLTDLIAGFAPWLCPIPTAWLIGKAAFELLNWPLAVAICAALIVESLGLASVNTALTLRNYNQAKRKTDPGAPFPLAALVVGVYLAVAVLLTVALDIFPSLATFAPAIFPALSLAGVLVLTLRSDHRRRLESIAQERAAKRAERQEARKVTTVKRKGETVKAGRQVSTVKIDGLLDIYKGDPLTTPTQAARALDLSRQTIYTYLEKLEESGRIRKNGHGVEVIG